MECHTVSAKDQSRLHQFGKKDLLGIFLGYALHAERIWKEDFWIADIEELENLDASEIHARTLSATEVLIPKTGEHFTFPMADGTVKSSGREQVFRRSTSIQDNPAQGDVPQGESDGSPLDTPTDDSEARNDFWTIAGNYIDRPRVQLHVKKEESFPIPLEYSDVGRRTNTTLEAGKPC